MHSQENNEISRVVNYRQLMLGLVALFFGLLVYLTERNFIPFFGEYELFDSFSMGLSRVSGFLPSFIHALAFCLLCAAFFPSKKRIPIFICCAWAIVHTFLELGQLKTLHGILFSNDALWNNTLMMQLAHYFKRGTFDVLDILSAALGCVFAFVLIKVTEIKQSDIFS